MKKRKHLSGLDIALLFVGIFDIFFVLAMILTFWAFQDTPNVLVLSVFAATFGECGFCSYIWNAKSQREKNKNEEVDTDVNISTDQQHQQRTEHTPE